MLGASEKSGAPAFYSQKRKTMKNNYYFCAHEGIFGQGCQIISVEGANLPQTAKQWKETNGYESVYVYDMNHKFVWSF